MANVQTAPVMAEPTCTVPLTTASTTCANTITKSHQGLETGLLPAALSALALSGIYLTAKSKQQQNTSKQENKSKQEDKSKCLGNAYCMKIPTEQTGAYGQNINDPNDPRNNDDPQSPFYHRKGAYGQDIYDANNPYNKQDPLSPYYDPNNNC